MALGTSGFQLDIDPDLGAMSGCTAAACYAWLITPGSGHPPETRRRAMLCGVRPGPRPGCVELLSSSCADALQQLLSVLWAPRGHRASSRSSVSELVASDNCIPQPSFTREAPGTILTWRPRESRPISTRRCFLDTQPRTTRARLEADQRRLRPQQKTKAERIRPKEGPTAP